VEGIVLSNGKFAQGQDNGAGLGIKDLDKFGRVL
jgi:hypothetical protein